MLDMTPKQKTQADDYIKAVLGSQVLKILQELPTIQILPGIIYSRTGMMIPNELERDRQKIIDYLVEKLNPLNVKHKPEPVPVPEPTPIALIPI